MPKIIKYNLPRGYLSYSQVDLWLKSKSQYRKRYYQNDKPIETVETRFGHQIHEIMEDPKKIKKYPELATVPRYSVSEHDILVEVDGVMVKGRIDSYDPETFSFSDMKSGHRNKKGEEPWNNVKVRKTLQLPWYSFLIWWTEGRVDPICFLIWIETRFKHKTIEFEGHKLTNESRELELTGVVKVFKRRIAKWERERVRKLIGKVAREIHKDYVNYLQTL